MITALACICLGAGYGWLVACLVYRRPRAAFLIGLVPFMFVLGMAVAMAALGRL